MIENIFILTHLAFTVLWITLVSMTLVGPFRYSYNNAKPKNG